MKEKVKYNELNRHDIKSERGSEMMDVKWNSLGYHIRCGA